MANRLGFALANAPSARGGPARTNAHLSVHAPALRIACVLWMIEDCDVSLILATLNFHAQIDPH